MTRRLCGLAMLVWFGTAVAEETEEQRLSRGEVVVLAEPLEGSRVPRVTAKGIIDVPPETLWPLIDQCGNYSTTMIHITSSEEISRIGDIVVCRSTVDLPFPLPSLTSTTEGVHTAKPGERYERRWSLVEGPYKDNSGVWTLVPHPPSGNRTLVTYVMHADPNLPIPGWVQRMAQRKSIPQLFQRLGQLARAAGSAEPSR